MGKRVIWVTDTWENFKTLLVSLNVSPALSQSWNSTAFFLMSAWLIALWQWVYIDVIKPLPEILHCKFSCNRIEAYTASIVVGDGFFGKSVKLSKKIFQGWREGHIIKLRNVFNIRANYHCDTLHYSPTPLHTLTHANYKSAQTTKLRTDVLN